MLKILNAPPGEHHPLEPLTATEVVSAVDIVRRRADVTPQFRFVSVTLQEPDKSTKEADESDTRRAFVILLDNATGMGFEAIMDLASATVTSWRALGHGVQPPIMLDEFIECEEAVKRSPLFLDALKKRGASDVSLVMVDPWSAGAYGTEPEGDKVRRLSRALCWIRSEPNDNGYARPIDAIVVMVDLNRMEVLRIEDYGVAPLPPESNNWYREYIPKTRGDLKPLEIVQPNGPSFKVSGHEISWQKWRFRISFTPREGLVLHTVTYNDEGRERPILHRASVCDMVVPYGDPGEAYYRKNAFDIGEYGVGMLANSLAAGVRLPRSHSLLRCPFDRQPRQALHDQKCCVPARGRLRCALEAHRLAHEPGRGSTQPAARGFIFRDSGQLRVRLLLELLSGRLDPA